MHRNIKLLALFNFFTDLDFLAPVAILYFSKVSGSYALGMSILSVIMLSSALFEIPTGIFSDRVGRRKTVIAGSVSGILSAVIFAMGESYTALMAGAVAAGLTRAFYSGNNEALLYDTLKQDLRQTSFHDYLGKLSSFFQIALAASAVLGSVMASISYSFLLWISVLPKIAMFIVSIFLIEPSGRTVHGVNALTHLGESFRLFRKNRRLGLLTAGSAIQFAIGESAYVFRSVFVASLWPLWTIGIANMLSNIGAAVSYYLSGKLIGRFKLRQVLYVEILYNRAANLLALFFPSIVSPVLMSTTSVLYGLGEVARKTLLQHEFTDHQRATLGSMTSFTGQLAFTAVSLAIGQVADLIGPRSTLIFVHTVLIIPLFLFRAAFSRKLRN